MELNEYQKMAMSTCLPSCENEAYMLNGLTAEVGEVNDLIAKWVRKGIARFDSNRLVFNTSDPNVRREYVMALMKEIGDCAWFLAGLTYTLGVELNEVCWMNIDKLANRKKEGTIISHSDH